MIFINTRPANRAKPLTVFLQSQGVTVLELPLLELVKCELSEKQHYYLFHIQDYQTLIFISETAVSHFFDFIQKYQINLNPNITYIAVGQKTAQTFNHFWQKSYHKLPHIITPSQFNLPENNEGLLQLPVIQNLKQGNNILVLKGKDGRELLKRFLMEKGIKVDEVDFYQRIFPVNSTQLLQNFFLNDSSDKKIIVLITSLTAWQHWQTLRLTLSNTTVNFHYLILQSRIAESVAKSTSSFTVLKSLEPNEILEKLNSLA